MRVAPIVLAICTAVAVPNAQAATPVSGSVIVITDPAGDWPLAAGDITTVRFRSVAKPTRHLEMRLSLSGEAGSDVSSTINVAFAYAGCDRRTLTYSPGTDGAGRGYDDSSLCTDSGTVVADPSVSSVSVSAVGHEIVWQVPFGPALRPGTLLTDLKAFSTVGTIVETPVGGRFYAEGTVADEASSGRTYRVR